MPKAKNEQIRAITNGWVAGMSASSIVRARQQIDTETELARELVLDSATPTVEP